MKRLSIVSLLLAVGISGCASNKPEPEPEPEATLSVSALRERQMHERWAGHDYSELIAEMGKPLHEMTIPRYGWPNSSALLYGQDEASGCIDAFLIVKGDERTWVEDYYCR